MSLGQAGVGAPGDQLEATPGDQLHGANATAPPPRRVAGPFGAGPSPGLSPRDRPRTEWGASSVPGATSAPGSSTL